MYEINFLYRCAEIRYVLYFRNKNKFSKYIFFRFDVINHFVEGVEEKMSY